MLRCSKCRWAETSTGNSKDLTHLKEVVNCASCSGRTFKCPKCGANSKLFRIKGNT